MLTQLIDRFSHGVSPDTVARLFRTTPAWLNDRISLERFRRTVRWAGERSAFYKRQFARHGVNPRKVHSPADLKDFFTTPDDVAAHAEEFVCRLASIVFESSGTSGRNKRIYYSRDELEVMGQSMAAGLKMMGVTPGDRVANAFDFCIWIPGMLGHYSLMHAGNFCLAFGKVDPVEVYRRIKQYNFNVILGEPTWLIRLTELAERDGGGNLKMMVGGAEEMPAEAFDWIKRVWNGCTVKMCYGTVEQGLSMGFQPCPNHDGYHLDDADFLPEIIEPDGEGYGELIFTTLRRTVMPLIRYRSRDVTRFQPPCACGIRAPRIDKLRGRRDELIVASGGNLYPLMFENILRPIAGVGMDYQVVFSLEGVREIVEVSVETERNDEQALLDEMIRSATDQYPDLIKNLNLGIFELRARARRPGSIRTARKLKRLVDRRHVPAASREEVADGQLV